MSGVNGTLLDNVTSAIISSSPTVTPIVEDIAPCDLSFDMPCDGGDGADFEIDKEALWMIMWISSLVIFLCLPFCISQSRRELCWRRIKERRWISDDREDDWYTAAVRRQQEQRQQELEEQQRRFRTSRTQEDEIREQFLLQCMESYTMTLSESDIHDMQETGSLKRSGSQHSLGSRRSFSSSRKANAAMQDDQSDSGTIPIDLEAQIVIVTTNSSDVKEQRSDSLTDDEEDQAMLAFDFDDGHQKVYVPLPGQTIADVEAAEGTPSSKRLVSSGCAICLCLFESGEKITWSANPECGHIYHSDCVLNWYLAVGRKNQKRRIRHHPEMSDEEILSKICDFQTNCPCCRQNFCQDIRKADVSAPSTVTESDSDEEMQQGDESVEGLPAGSSISE